MYGLTSREMTFDQLCGWATFAVGLWIIVFYMYAHHVFVPVINCIGGH
jgi:hypothetical protein